MSFQRFAYLGEGSKDSCEEKRTFWHRFLRMVNIQSENTKRDKLIEWGYIRYLWKPDWTNKYYEVDSKWVKCVWSLRAGPWRDLPCLMRQVKYRTPATEPSFFPSGLSSSTPAQRPPENSVLPQNRSLPTCAHIIIHHKKSKLISTVCKTNQNQNKQCSKRTCWCTKWRAKWHLHGGYCVKGRTPIRNPITLSCDHVDASSRWDKLSKGKMEIKAWDCARKSRGDKSFD